MEDKEVSTGHHIEPIVKKRLSDQVFDRLRSMIVSGELAPDDVMPSERTLMNRFLVGRPAVREALQIMASKGFIRINHGERSRVNKLDAELAFDQVNDVAKLLLSSEPANLEQLKQVRKILEVGALKIAVNVANQSDIHELYELIAEQDRQIGNSDAFIQADVSFHLRIAQVSGNSLLKASMQAILKWLFEHHIPPSHWAGREKFILLDHENIVKSLEKRDFLHVENLITDHLDKSELL